MDSSNPKKPPQLIKPEGSRKIVVLNGSCQSVSYLNGRISEIKGNQAQESKQDQKASKKTVNHGHSL